MVWSVVQKSAGTDFWQSYSELLKHNYLITVAKLPLIIVAVFDNINLHH